MKLFFLSFIIFMHFLNSFKYNIYLYKNFNILNFYYFKKNPFIYNMYNNNNTNYLSNIKKCNLDKDCDYPDVCCVNFCCSPSFVTILHPKPKPVLLFSNK